MTICLIRHGDAVSRLRWGSQDDLLRPLTDVGRYQASDIVGMVQTIGVEAIRTSPCRRCIETVAPLAAAIGLSAKIDDRLAEGPAKRALHLVRALASEGTHAALCSHGDVIPEILAMLAEADGVAFGVAPRCQKGSVWVLDADPDGKIVTGRYLEPKKHGFRIDRRGPAGVEQVNSR